MSFGVIDPDKAFSVGLGYTGAFNSVWMGSRVRFSVEKSDWVVPPVGHQS